MRAPSWCLLLAACAAVSVVPTPARGADDAAELKGNWKFSILSPLSESELMILGVGADDGKPSAEVKSAIPQLKNLKVSKFAVKGDRVTFAVALPNGDAPFSGTVKGDKIRGTLSIAGQVLPIEMTKTEADAIKPGPPDNALVQDYLAARQEEHTKEKVKKWEALLKKVPGSPKAAIVYDSMLKLAEAADLDEKTVRGYIEEWVNGARPYGTAYAADVKTKALNALSGQKAYAGLALELATEAEKALDKDASKEQRAEVAGALATAAKLAGKDDLAKQAGARADALEAEVDVEYHKTVPPFKPEVSLGRKDKTSDRVVLLELFTGAQCPPCVAADVAFDALLKTYKPTELVALEYHLHIPGPDPLTNPDSKTRAEYYPDLRGTPATYFNGKSEAYGGGGMGNSKTKYDEYRQFIDSALEKSKRVDIDLQATREGDEIKIVATARAEAKKDKDEKKDGDEKKSNLKLRLALVEEEIRYVGGNKNRLHHHVVRSLPGGVEGKALADGQGKAEVTVNLADVRKGLESYLSDFAKTGGGFPGRQPEIKLAHLSVVAFVQDDADKSVLHAVITPVGGESK